MSTADKETDMSILNTQLEIDTHLKIPELIEAVKFYAVIIILKRKRVS